jgi:nucleotide-binding universal stress UspA family protein
LSDSAFGSSHKAVFATMYGSLMVPLDRSPVAELALPFAVAIAQRSQAALELVEVHRSYLYDNRHAANAWALKADPAEEDRVRSEERQYLADTSQRVTAGLTVSATTNVLTGSVVDSSAIVDSLLAEARRKSVDLIVMTTRVRGLVSRLGLGSVADEVVRRSHIPVLLIWPGADQPPSAGEPVLKSFLILLDGSPLSEEILVPAVELARLMNARCKLLRVVAPKSGGQAQAEQYLERIAAVPREQGLQVESQVIVAAHPVAAILHAAEAEKSNLIALATHGYGGFKRLVLGSVADQIIRHASLPVLVQCPIPKG